MEHFIDFVWQYWYLWLALVLILGLLIYYETSGQIGGITFLSPQVVVQQINQHDAVIVDMRDAEAFKKGHIVNAMNILPSDLEHKAKKLRKHKAKPVIVVCQQGQKSPNFANNLRKQGFEKVLGLKGGMRAWEDAGFPVVKATKPKSIKKS